MKRGQPEILKNNSAAFSLTWESKSLAAFGKVIFEVLGAMAITGLIGYETGNVGNYVLRALLAARGIMVDVQQI